MHSTIISYLVLTVKITKASKTWAYYTKYYLFCELLSELLPCVNWIHEGNTKTATMHSWSAKKKFIPLFFCQNRDTYTAKFITSEQGQKAEAWILPVTYQRPGAGTHLHKAVFYNFQSSCPPFPLSPRAVKNAF